MTVEELAKLTPEEKRIRIAKLCGWRNCVLRYDDQDNAWFKGWPPGEAKEQLLHNYPCDLNAMHEAEQMLGVENRGNYLNHLSRIIGQNNPCLAVHATAAQRADAFLLTLG